PVPAHPPDRYNARQLWRDPKRVVCANRLRKSAGKPWVAGRKGSAFAPVLEGPPGKLRKYLRMQVSDTARNAYAGIIAWNLSDCSKLQKKKLTTCEVSVMIA